MPCVKVKDKKKAVAKKKNVSSFAAQLKLKLTTREVVEYSK